MSLRLFARSLALAAALAPLSACSPTITKPALLAPGTAPQQRYRATQFDPYPSTDMGPEIVGGRPLDYAIPQNEVTRARQYDEEKRARLGQSFVPVVPGGAVIGPAVPYGAPTPTIPTYPAGPTYPQTLPTYPQTLPTYPTPSYTPPAGSSQPPVEYRY